MNVCLKIHWTILVACLIIGVASCSETPTEPLSSRSGASSDQSTSSLDTGTSSSGSGTSDDSSSDTSGYCDGTELLCLSSITEENVAQYQGASLGGTFYNGQFTPSSTGGLEFPLTINVSKNLMIEFEIEGNIPNWDRGEDNGGKVSLLTIQEDGGTYYLSLQRMDGDYRGGGLFRVILGDKSNILTQGAAFLITHENLAGQYSMEDWGDEQHQFQLSIQGNDAQMNIDSYSSNRASAPYSISGQRQVTFVLGNRESSKVSLGEAALTRFQRVRIFYD
jgi:hypothetical protein